MSDGFQDGRHFCGHVWEESEDERGLVIRSEAGALWAFGEDTAVTPGKVLGFVGGWSRPA